MQYFFELHFSSTESVQHCGKLLKNKIDAITLAHIDSKFEEIS